VLERNVKYKMDRMVKFFVGRKKNDYFKKCKKIDAAYG
jgi:hypothetical protein